MKKIHGNYIEEYRIDYNEEIFDKMIQPEDSILGMDAYLFDKGDKIHIKITKSSESIADKLLNAIVINNSRYSLVVNLGGFINNISWKDAREEILF